MRGLTIGILAISGFAASAYTAEASAATPLGRGQLAGPPAIALPGVIDVGKTRLTKEQFDRLPDSQVLEFHGRRATAGELRSRQQTRLSHRGAGRTTAAALKANVEASRQRFLANQKARISAANAQVLARFQRPAVRPAFPGVAGPVSRPSRAGIESASRLALTAPPSPVRINDCSSTGAQDSLGMPHPGAVQPGSVVSCTGVKFGEQPGFAMLKGLRKANGSAPDIVLTVNSWSDSGDATGNVSSAAFTIPGDLSGYRAQQAMILITTRGGTSSNSFAIGFYPLLDRVAFVQVGGTCGGQNNANICGPGTAYVGNDGAPYFQWGGSGVWGAAHGGHCGWLCFVNGDQGTDNWSGTLANDWVFSELDFYPDPNWPKQTREGVFVPGPSTKFSVGWSYDYGFASAGIEYNFTIWGQGPLGVPWQ